MALITVSLATGMVLKAMEVVLLECDSGDSALLRVPGSSKTVNAVADIIMSNRYATAEELWESGRGGT
jgi:hypothetical protein